ncbi:hypothetical protein DEO72_LG4g460 [Vigna unguiculata]|uniref:Uncharacterized protein n=1 Tax=Vigna unguiculata TaxID=3917 RepID=A0A4D6LNB1_VIGUN|nr:hypothetical protein DEO72_LG4g460 [Vigna unguiculata]
MYVVASGINPQRDAGEKSTPEDLPPKQIIDVRKGSNDYRINLDAGEKSTPEDLPPKQIIDVRKGSNDYRINLVDISTMLEEGVKTTPNQAFKL